jgi:Electron transfer DM13
MRKTLKAVSIAAVLIALGFGLWSWISLGHSGVEATVAASSSAAIGTLTGHSGHDARGSARIAEESGKRFVVLSDDFYLKDAPAAWIAFGDAAIDKSTEFVQLTKFEGGQRFEIPASIDPKRFSQLWIWCRKFDVPLAVARLT